MVTKIFYPLKKVSQIRNRTTRRVLITVLYPLMLLINLSVGLYYSSKYLWMNFINLNKSFKKRWNEYLDLTFTCPVCGCHDYSVSEYYFVCENCGGAQEKNG
jgi:hypothetical protein